MREVTIVVNAQITKIVPIDEESKLLSNAEISSNIAEAIKEELNCDDVVITEIQRFIGF